MALQSLDFATIVGNVGTAMQAKATARLTLTVGSVLRAIAEAFAAPILWLQGQIAYVATITRAATSTGDDLDSFVGDFGLTRLAATYATGTATFSRFSGAGRVVVPLNARIQTSDATQSFLVALDSGNSAYSAVLGGYVMADATTSVDVPVQAVVAGTGGNVLGSTIAVITSTMPGVDKVTNASAFTNGVDKETDPALRARFRLFIASLSKATESAIRFAVASVQANLTCTVTENYAYGGTWQPGFFYVVADDGSGSPADSLLDAIRAAVDAVRGFTIQFAVFGPSVETADVNMSITSLAGYVHNDVAAAVATALNNFIAALPLGQTLYFTQLAAVAYGVAGVASVGSYTINSGTSDLTANQKQIVRAGTVTVA